MYESRVCEMYFFVLVCGNPRGAFVFFVNPQPSYSCVVEIQAVRLLVVNPQPSYSRIRSSARLFIRRLARIVREHALHIRRCPVSMAI